MDDIKNRGMRQLSNWHFINLPICDYPNWTDPAACNNISVDSILDNTEDEDALWAIEQAIITLKSNYAQGFERGFAMRNLLHLVGDIHQPLHAVARYSDETPNGDRGGNDFLITNVPFTDNLHGFWDSGFGLLNNSITRPLNASASDYLSNLADNIIALTAGLTTGVTSYNVTEWAIDSRNIAIEYAYNLTFNSTPSAEYIATSWPIVEQQLGLAGYRLYQVLLSIKPCSSATQNCPEESEDHSDSHSEDSHSHSESEHAHEEDEKYENVVIALGIGLGVSLLFNMVLLIAYCKRPAHPEESVPLRASQQ
jgi:hypothetical protein